MSKPTQPEQALEDHLVTQLTGLGFARVVIRDEADLLVNLKQQIERHNGVTLTDAEFGRVLRHLEKGNGWTKSATGWNRFQLTTETSVTV